jgi:sugar lactone lactonase YvrE
VTKVITPLAGSAGNPGYLDDPIGANARFDGPYGVALMTDGSILVADQNNHRLRQVTQSGAVTTYAGTGAAGLVDGPRLAAAFDLPQAVAVDASNNVYISDVGNHRIRMIDATGTTFTVAGDGVAGWKDDIGANAEFFGQEGIGLSPSGTILYVADGNGGDSAQPFNRIRAVLLP